MLWLGMASAFSLFIGNIKDGIKFVYDMDNALNQVRIVTGKSKEEVASLAQEYNKLGKEMGVTTKEIALTSADLYRQGLKGTDLDERMQSIIKYAKISGISLAESNKIVTATTNSLGISAQKAVDVMSYLGDVSASDAAEVGEAMQKVAGTADALNVSYEKTASWIATVSSKTREGASVIGNSIKSIMSRYTAIKSKGFDAEDGTDVNMVTQALKTAGVVAADSRGVLRNFGEVVDELGGKWKNLNPKLQDYVATQMAGSFQMNRFRTLMNDYSKSVEYYNGAMNSAGIANKKFEIQQESSAAALDRMKISMEEFWMKSFNSDFIKGAMNLLQGLFDILSKMGGIVPILAGVLGGVLTTAIMAVESGVAILNIQLTYTNVLMGGLPLLIGAIVTGITMFAMKTEEAKVEVDGLNKALEVQTRSSSELKTEQEKLNKESSEYIAKVEKEAVLAQALSDKLFDLAEGENKTTLQKEQMIQVVNKLNEILPDLNANYDKENDKLSIQKEVVDAAITSFRNLALVKAASIKSTDAAIRLVEAELNIDKQKIKKGDLENRQKALSGGIYSNTTMGAGIAIDGYKEEINAIQSEIEKNEAVKKEAEGVIKQLDDITKKYSKDIEKSKSSKKNYGEEGPYGNPGGNKESTKTAIEYENFAEASIRAFNKQVEIDKVQSKSLEKQIKTANSAKDYSKELQLQNELLKIQNKTKDDLISANDKIRQSADALRGQNKKYDTTKWFDLNGEDTEEYGKIYNSFANRTDNAAKVEQKRIKELHDGLQALKKAWLGNRDAVDSMDDSIASTIQKMQDIKETAKELAKDIVENEKKETDRLLKKEEDAFEEISTTKERYFHKKDLEIDEKQRLLDEKQRSLDEQKREQEDYISGAEKTLTLKDFSLKLSDWNNDIQNKKITLFDTEIAQLTAMEKIDRRRMDILNKQLDIEKQKLVVQNVEQEKNVRIFKDGKFQWSSDPRKVREEKEKLSTMELEFAKDTADKVIDIKQKQLEAEERKYSDEKRLIDDEKRLWEEEKYNKQNALADSRKIFETKYQDIEALTTKFLQDVYDKFKGKWDEILNYLAEQKKAITISMPSVVSSGGGGGGGGGGSAWSAPSSNGSVTGSVKNDIAYPSQNPNNYGWTAPATSGTKQSAFSSPAPTLSADDWSVMGGPVTYNDEGGENYGKGLMAKNIIEPERVLSPEQTKSFNRLVNLMPNILNIIDSIMPKVNIPSFSMAGHNNVASNSNTTVINIDKVMTNDANSFINLMKRKIRSN